MSADSPAGGQVPPPDGYLGADARITSGPAPELVEAGYALETADAPLLHRGLTIADLAHLAELVEAGVVRREDAAPMLAALLKLLEVPADEFSYDPVYGDAYNSRERVLERQIGADAGWVHLGRTRREAGRIAFRLALRDLLLDLHADVAAFASAAADQAAGTPRRSGRTPPTCSQPSRPHSGTTWAASPSRRCAIWTGSRRPTSAPTSHRAGPAEPAAPGCRWTATGWPAGSASPRRARTPGT